MKIFVCTRVNDKDADTYAHNAKLVSRAMMRFGKDIEVKTPFYEGRYPANTNHFLYSLGKSILYMAECNDAVFPEECIGLFEITLRKIWENTHI